MPRSATPPAEVVIDAGLVRSLIEDQHPDLAHLSVAPVGAGWDNALFRLGDGLAVRLPRRALAAPLILNEQRWLGLLAPLLPLPIPVPIRTGLPGRGYPWSWSITPWFEGHAAGILLGDRAAHTLGKFLAALHANAPRDAPLNPFRSVPLSQRTDRVYEHVRELEGMVDHFAVLSCWERLTAAESYEGPPVWIHGDLHQSNVLVASDRIVAVIDFGDLAAGDPAVDLAAAWMLFTPEARATFRDAAGRPDKPIDDNTWKRSQGWALALNLAWLAQCDDDKEVTQQTLSAIHAVLSDHP